ncbi:AMP phosphorylase [Candidatus Woesearchaeota archaeon]|nr:MAG: AMP phosphorylase [Candidatus Woesearchaeota archaeon]
MKLKVKDMDISTGDIQIIILNEKDAHDLDLHPMDRLVLTLRGKQTIAILDIAESKKAVPPGRAGLFEETLHALSAKDGDTIKIGIADKPESVAYIRKKMDGGHLSPKELATITQDITQNKLTDVELTSFVVASYTRGMNMHEIAALTKAMAKSGDRLTFGKYPLVDVHSIGGVAGNRTTMLIVPLLVAAGCTVPKTSSRAITSPAGTADTMEILCPVSLPTQKLKKIINDVGGFIIWGGSVNLAPADDKIIRIEHPLSIDAEGQMLASIMAKKASVGATHLLMEIPLGPGTKVKDKRQAKHLAKHFAELGNLLGIKVKTITTDGSQPIGSGIGPILEARDVIWALKSDPRAPSDLIDKSLQMTGTLLEFCGKAVRGKGRALAKQLLTSGAAYGAMVRIVEAQGGKMPKTDDLLPAKMAYTLRAHKTGKIKDIPNALITKVARLAGAPIDPDAGIFLHTHCSCPIKKGEPIITIYARSSHKLDNAVKQLKRMGGISVR